MCLLLNLLKLSASLHMVQIPLIQKSQYNTYWHFADLTGLAVQFLSLKFGLFHGTDKRPALNPVKPLVHSRKF